MTPGDFKKLLNPEPNQSHPRTFRLGLSCDQTRERYESSHEFTVGCIYENPGNFKMKLLGEMDKLVTKFLSKLPNAGDF